LSDEVKLFKTLKRFLLSNSFYSNNEYIATTVNELEIYTPLGYNAASTDLLTTFWDNLSVPSLSSKNPKRKPAVQIRSLCKEECGWLIVLSSVVLASRIDASDCEGGIV
jgi:hypothetical protein